MIIHVRGTSGSGKSTLVSRILDRLDKVEVKFADSERVVGYKCRLPGGELYVPGKYANGSGGFDVLPSEMRNRDEFWANLEEWGELFTHVLFEGATISDETQRTAKLARTCELRVVRLTTPIEECIASVKNRRVARGKEETFNEKNTRSRHDSLQKVYSKLKFLGVKVHSLDREAAYAEVCKLIGVSP